MWLLFRSGVIAGDRCDIFYRIISFCRMSRNTRSILWSSGPSKGRMICLCPTMRSPWHWTTRGNYLIIHTMDTHRRKCGIFVHNSALLTYFLSFILLLRLLPLFFHLLKPSQTIRLFNWLSIEFFLSILSSTLSYFFLRFLSYIRFPSPCCVFIK